MINSSELTRRIAGAVHVLRPEWPVASILTFLGRHLPDHPRDELAVALVACALARNADGGWTAETPRYLLDGDWLADSPHVAESWAAAEKARKEREDRLADQRIRRQAAARCVWCDDDGRLDNGHLCPHTDPERRTAAAKANVDQLRALVRPGPIRTDRQPEPDQESA